MLILEESSFSKVELPSIIYKYRSFEKDEEKRMLTNNEIYLANPDEFIKKGSKDCEFFVKYKDYSYGELLDYYFNNPRYPLSTEDRLTDAIRMANEPPY
ncbi:MAG TPA: hypothetical protein PLS10_09195, partial [Chitinophagales bacterium]|nr:hypothetical protein [Chitinophagales bacterium]